MLNWSCMRIGCSARLLICARVYTLSSAMQVVIETDPIKLWVPPTSSVLAEKEHFDAAFTPFFRTEQIMISLDNSGTVLNDTYGANYSARVNVTGLMDVNVFLAVKRLVDRVTSIVVPYEQTAADGTTTTINVTWDSVCTHYHGSKRGCALQSPTEWFAFTGNLQPGLSQDDFTAQLTKCLGNVVFYQDCRGSIGVPSFPYVTLGGYPAIRVNSSQYLNATMLIVTLLLDNEPYLNDPAKAWEKEFLKLASEPEYTSLIGLKVIRYVCRQVCADPG